MQRSCESIMLHEDQQINWTSSFLDEEDYQSRAEKF